MKLRPTQFGVRENTASPRQHAPRRVVSPSILQSDPLFGNEQQDEDTQEQAPPMKETFELSLTEPDQGATGGGDSGTTTPGLVGDGKRSAVERPLTCEEAAAFVRVHPRTVKRMARVKCQGISVLDVGISMQVNWTAGCEWNYTRHATLEAQT